MSDPVKLTKTKVEALKPDPAKQYLVWDSELKGYGVRVSPGGAKAFFVQGRIRGSQKEIKIAIGRLGPALTAEQAREEAKDALEAMRKGTDPRLTKQDDEQAVTFGAMMLAYVEILESAGKASAGNVRNAVKKDLKLAFPKLWKKPADEITIDDCVRLIAKLNDEGSPRQADKLRSYIKTAFTTAINARGNVKAPKAMRDMRLTQNPAAMIQKVAGSSQASERALSLPEFRAYWRRIQELPEPRRSVAMLHVLTGGQRMQQLARVTLADIDRDAMLMRMADGKGRRQQARIYCVPLLPQALECINNITGSGQFVFSSNGGLSPMHISYLSDIAADVCAAMAEAKELQGAPFTGKVIRATIETRLMKAPYRVSSDVLARLLSHYRAEGAGMSETRRPPRDLSHLKGADLEATVRFIEAEKAHPFTQAQRTIYDFIGQCVTDPNFRQSPGLLDLILVVRDVLADGATDSWTVHDYLSPIEEVTLALIKKRESEKNTTSAKKPRLGARDPMKARIIDIMKTRKNSGMVFADFMSAWKREPQERLILKTINPKCKQDKQEFKVEDDGQAPLPTKNYRYNTLRSYWNKS